MIGDKTSQYFQDRDEIIAKFDHLWVSSDTKALILDGFSGHGKSTLINWLIENRCEKLNIPYSIVNLKVERGFNELLSGFLRGKIRTYIPTDALQLFDEKRDRILQDLSDSRKGIIVHQTQNNSPNSSQTIHLGIAEMYHHEETYARNRLSEAWLACLEHFTGEKLVIFLDTVDNFLEHTPSEIVNWLWSTLNDALFIIPELRIIVASRESVPDGVLSGMVHEELKPFSAKDSDELLNALGVTDESFRRAVYAQLAKGHPFVTNLAANAWQSFGENITTVKIPNLLDVGNYDRAINWIQQEIISRLEEPLKSAIRWVSLLRQFNLDTLNNVLKDKLNRPLDSDDFEKLCRYAFVKRVNAAWTCHDLLRKVQLSHLRKTEPMSFVELHHRASEYYTTRDKIEYLYHNFFWSHNAYYQWEEAVILAETEYKHGLTEQLLAIIETPEVILESGQQADFYIRRGNFNAFRGGIDLARLDYSSAFDIFREIGSHWGQASALTRLGMLDAEQGNTESAKHRFLSALEFYSSTQFLTEKANLLLYLGDLMAWKYGGEAEKYYDEALLLFHKLGDDIGAANVHLGIGNTLLMTGDDEITRTHYQNALKLYQENKQLQGEANALRRLGDLNVSSSDYDAAAKNYEAARLLFKTTGNKRGQANSDWGLGKLYLAKRETTLAKQYFETAYKSYSAMGDLQGQANVFLEFGLIAKMEERNEEAEHHLKKALSLYEKIDESQGQGNVLLELADLDLKSANYENTRKLCVSAMALFERSGDLGAKANCLKILATVSANEQEADAALNYAREALWICTKFKKKDAQTQMLTLMGTSAWLKGDIQRARAYLRKAMIYVDRTKQFELYLIILHSTANLERGQVNIEVSKKYYETLLSFEEYPTEVNKTDFIQWRQEYESLFLSTVSEEQRTNLLTTWLNSNSWQASKKYFKKYESIFLSTESLNTLLAILKEHPEERQLIEQGIHLIERSRNIGIDATYKQFEITLEQRQLQPLLLEWLNSKNLQISEAYLKTHQSILLTADAEAALVRLAEINPQIEKTVSMYLKLLQACRVVGIETVYNNLNSTTD